MVALDDLMKTEHWQEVQISMEGAGPDTVAKIMFTSGSTGKQKGVIMTRHLLCSNMSASVQPWPFMSDHPTVLLDWLPWIYGALGNQNLDMVLYNAGAPYVDAGKPTKGLMEQTVVYFCEVSPAYVTNVLVGFAAIVEALRSDEAKAECFFRQLNILFCMSTSLPLHIWNELRSLAD